MTLMFNAMNAMSYLTVKCVICSDKYLPVSVCSDPKNLSKCLGMIKHSNKWIWRSFTTCVRRHLEDRIFASPCLNIGFLMLLWRVMPIGDHLNFSKFSFTSRDFSSGQIDWVL